MFYSSLSNPTPISLDLYWRLLENQLNLIALFSLTSSTVPLSSLEAAFTVFVTLLARCLLKLIFPTTPWHSLWIREVLHFVKLERIRCIIRVYESWTPHPHPLMIGRYFRNIKIVTWQAAARPSTITLCFGILSHYIFSFYYWVILCPQSLVLKSTVLSPVFVLYYLLSCLPLAPSGLSLLYWQ